MINIDESYLVGKGHHRKVYRHPENDKLCIKVIFGGPDHSSELAREKAYYKHLKNRGVSWSMLPAYHGDVITNLGKGSVFDLIADTSGKVSKTLGYYLSSNQLTSTHYDELINALSSFKKYLLEQRIITKGLAHRNIVCLNIDSQISKLYIVDNIGNTEFIPISSFIGFYARNKINRKWRRFEQKLLSNFPENKALERIIQQL